MNKQVRIGVDIGGTFTDIALEVGCGSGYAACVLARLCATVVALECDGALATLAERNLAAESADNTIVVRGDLTAGYAEQGPYDVIFVNGAVAAVPEALDSQLAEGGRMVAVVRAGAGHGIGTLFRRVGGSIARSELFDAATPVLPGFDAPRGFTF